MYKARRLLGLSLPLNTVITTKKASFSFVLPLVVSGIEGLERLQSVTASGATSTMTKPEKQSETSNLRVLTA